MAEPPLRLKKARGRRTRHFFVLAANLRSEHNFYMPATTTIELPESLHQRLKQRSEESGMPIGSLIVRAVEEAYAEPVTALPKTGRRVTLPLIPATGTRGPLYPVDENPHDLVFS
jgi:hypothetical protein